MRPIIIYLVLITIFLSSCDSNKKITQVEFERLFAHDSIESVQTNKNKPEVIIKVRSDNERNNTFILPVKSSEVFEDSFHKLRQRLISQNIHFRSYCSVEMEKGDYFLYFLTLIYPLFLISSFLLFLFTVVSVLKNRFETAIDKLIWVIVLLLPIIGPLLFIFIGRKQRLK